MCKKPNNMMRETKWVGVFQKDNQPIDTAGDPFYILIRPCRCGKNVLGRVPGGTYYAEIESVVGASPCVGQRYFNEQFDYRCDLCGSPWPKEGDHP